MKAKFAAALFCLLFAIPFGGVGAFASWMIGTMIYDGARAREWVKVKADVEGPATYRYSFGGASYTSDRLGASRVGGDDDIGDWQAVIGERFASAREHRKPITVFVNPDDPSEAMADREIRWGLVVFMLPFALAFGGVGVGALWVLTKIFSAPGKGAAPRAAIVAPATASNAGVAGLWFFAFFWNAIALPVTALALPDIIAAREWIGLFILIFPAVGMLLVVGAIGSTASRLRRGRATFSLATPRPRAGDALEGHVSFARGVAAGDRFTVRLVCERIYRGGDDQSTSVYWSKEIDARASATPMDVRIPFRFEAPAGTPHSQVDEAKRVEYRWRVELRPAGSRIALPYAFDIDMQAPPLERAGSEAPATTLPSKPAFDSLEKLLGGAVDSSRLSPEQRSALARITPEQRERIAKLVQFAPRLKKLVIGLVLLIVALQALPFVFMLVFSH